MGSRAYKGQWPVIRERWASVPLPCPRCGEPVLPDEPWGSTTSSPLPSAVEQRRRGHRTNDATEPQEDNSADRFAAEREAKAAEAFFGDANGAPGFPVPVLSPQGAIWNGSPGIGTMKLIRSPNRPMPPIPVGRPARGSVTCSKCHRTQRGPAT